MRFSKLLVTGIISAVSMTAAFHPVLQAGTSEKENCMAVVTNAELSYLQFKNAVKAKEAEDAKRFVHKGMEYAQTAASFAPQCDCVLAETYTLEAYSFGKKATDASDLKDIQKQAKKAMNLALSGMGAAQQCNIKK